MTEKTFCFQCGQAAGDSDCQGNTGVCGKTSATARLQDKLTGALIGLARATDGNTGPTADTYSALVEGLFATATNVCLDDAALEKLIDRAHREKAKLVPQCGSCASPCGRNNDYEMDKLWGAEEDIRSLKSQILFGLRGMAAYVYHASVLGYTDDEVNKFFAYGLFMLGEDLTAEQLLPVVLKIGEVNLKCMALRDKANMESYGAPAPEADRKKCSNEEGEK